MLALALCLEVPSILWYKEKGSQAEHRCIASLRRQRQWEFKEQGIGTKGEIHRRAQDLSLGFS